MSQIRPAIASFSLGAPATFPLPDRLRLAQQHGFKGIELFYGDLTTYTGNQRFNGNLLKAAEHIRQICDELDLTIVTLQPFRFYEALVDCHEKESILATKLPLWRRLARILCAEMILVLSNYLNEDPTLGKEEW